jgi:hypothetical protein
MASAPAPKLPSVTGVLLAGAGLLEAVPFFADAPLLDAPFLVGAPLAGARLVGAGSVGVVETTVGDSGTAAAGGGSEAVRSERAGAGGDVGFDERWPTN